MNKYNAKAIFVKYNGNHFQMTRDNVFTEYKKYNVSPSQEIIWKDELVNGYSSLDDLDSHLNLIDLIYLNIADNKYEELLSNIINRVTQSNDSFMKIIIAERLLHKLEYIDSNRKSYRIFFNKKINKNTAFLKEQSLKLLESASNMDIFIDNKYITSKIMEEKTSIENIRKRIDKDIKKIRNH